MTAAAILACCCPPLVDSLVEELLSTWHVSPGEAREIKALVDRWGDEPAHGRGQSELRAEIAGRIHDYLLARRAHVAVGAVLQ